MPRNPAGMGGIEIMPGQADGVVVLSELAIDDIDVSPAPEIHPSQVVAVDQAVGGANVTELVGSAGLKVQFQPFRDQTAVFVKAHMPQLDIGRQVRQRAAVGVKQPFNGWIEATAGDRKST